VSEGWSRCPGSNWRPRPYQGRALPTELHRPSPFGLRPTGRPSHLGFSRQVGLLISASADRSAFSSRLRPTSRPSHLGFGRQVGLLISASADKSAFSSRLRPTSRPSHLGFGRQVGLLVSASADVAARQSKFNASVACHPKLARGSRERRMERETGIEPATNSLEGCDSTTELLPPTRSLTSLFRATARKPA
jgi:hypothetical protein